jgi:uncharacterized protein YajQ (UPF0234 family)
MSNDPPAGRPPQFVGLPQSPDSVVSDYAEGVRKRRDARQEAAREGRPKLPNLLRADKQYNPSKDTPMTLDQMAQAQETMDRVSRGEEKAQAKPETIRGLQAIKEYSDKEHARMDAEVAEKTPEEEKPKDEEPKASSKEPTKKKSPKDMSDDEVNDTLASMDDMDLELLMERVRSDIINNEVERRAIDAKVKDIDLASGLATGEFTQTVPIKKGIEVTYRTVSQMENDNMRRILFNWNAEDARVATLAAERYGLMQTVCALVQINGTKLPRHLKDDGNGTYEFLEEVFLQKYKLVSSYPSPMIHMLGTHAFWFDQRVRKLFTVETVKNG